MANPVAGRGAWSIQRRNNAYQGRLLAGTFLAQAMPQNVSSTAMGVWRSGVVCTSSFGATVDLLAVAPGSGMTVNVHAGQAVIMRAGQGPYVGWSDTAVVLTLDASNAVNPRRDLIVMRVYDPALGDTMPTIGGVLTPCTIEVVTGTPAASPSDPTIPANATVLARVAVAANATVITNANVTDLRKGLAAAPTAPRPLLGGDSVADTGYLFGEQRYRSAGGALPELIDVWGKDSTWHGLRALPPVSTKAGGAGNTGALVTVGATFTLASQVIPDPGFPYYIVASANMYGVQGSNLITTAVIRLNSTSGTEIGTSYDNGAVTPAGSFYTILPSASGILTGATTVYWLMVRTGGTSNASGVAYTVNSTRAMLTTQVIPA